MSDHEPLLNVTEELENILSGVCEMMEIYELGTKEPNGSDLQAVVGQNVLESCVWVSLSPYA